jgi:phosphatidylglycerophosphatase C
MSKTVVFFDFDGTITNKDTFIEFIKFAKGKSSFAIGFAILAPVLIMYKLRLIKNWKAKEMVLSYFFSGIKEEAFKIICEDFCEKKLYKLLRTKALDEIQMHQKLERTVYIVSASPENWIEPWAKKMGINLIGTKLEVVDGKITGKLNGPNCYGLEKETRIKCEIDLSTYSEIWAYGDSIGDKELLALANKAFYKPFR